MVQFLTRHIPRVPSFRARPAALSILIPVGKSDPRFHLALPDTMLYTYYAKCRDDATPPINSEVEGFPPSPRKHGAGSGTCRVLESVLQICARDRRNFPKVG